MASLGLGGEGNYAYACARVKARKSLFLPRDTYLRLLNMDLPEISRSIGEGQYRKEVDELSSTHSGVDLIEHATYLNLARTYQAVLGFSKGELNTMVRYFLNRWDIYNFKTVLRGRMAGATWHDVEEDIVPAGVFDMLFYASLFAAPDMDEMAAILKRAAGSSGFEPVILGLMRERGALPGLAELENALEKEYFTRMRSSVPEDTTANKLFRNYLGVEIDVVNLKTMFKLKFGGVSLEKVAELLIDGGDELSGPQLRKLAAAGTFDGFIAELAGTNVFESVREPASRAVAIGSLNEVLLALDRHLLLRAKRFSHFYPLSVLPVIDYLLRKKTEVDNLRIIARGKQSGLSEDMIRSLLVL